MKIAVLILPNFNAAATLGFVDPFRIANYLNKEALYQWRLFSPSGGEVQASNGLHMRADPLSDLAGWSPEIGVVSTSWTPETFYGDEAVMSMIRNWGRRGIRVCGVDTGAFLIAKAGLLTGGRAATHYEHIDSFQEVFPEVDCTEDLLTIHGNILTCAGGAASMDMGLHVLRQDHGDALANAAARYALHDRMRGPGERQNVTNQVPIGRTTPDKLRRAIKLMEQNLEIPLQVPVIAASVGLSQRQLARLFKAYTGQSIVQYYRNIRLDRGRSLITQTEMSVLAIAVACGFDSAEYFARAYRSRFSTSPRQDRIDGRIPFEFRAWPMHAISSNK